MNWFNGLSFQWKIILVVVILLVIFYLYKRYSSQFKNLFQSRDIDPQQVILSTGEVITVNSSLDLPKSQKTILENLAGQIKTDIYGVNFIGLRDTEVYKKVSSLSDVEIDYLANYYKRYLTDGVSLYEDMSNENYSLFQDNSGFKDLLIKLEKTGNR